MTSKEKIEKQKKVLEALGTLGTLTAHPQFPRQHIEKVECLSEDAREAFIELMEEK